MVTRLSKRLRTIAAAAVVVLGVFALLAVGAFRINDSEETKRARRLEMVASQIEARGMKDKAVLEAMRKVPRHRFVPPFERAMAYDDGPLPIGEGQTISQPYI